ncbi:MAG: prolyl oligopeptidase family serine peptidase [Xanthomonadales bacterium]|nr:prolyl oligopeptidase family serine peptidase [Xanthomonadales bacterium]
MPIRTSSARGWIAPGFSAALLASFLLLPAISAQATERMTWDVAGLKREARVHLPDNPAGAPLVFGFHGHGGKASTAARKFELHRLWPDAVVVYMQGIPTPGRLTDPQGKKNGWQHARGEQGDRDLAFFDAVVKQFRDEYKIDESRIYSTGHSNGGGFTYLLWATHPDLFAAIAPSAAGGRAIRRGKPGPLPVMHFAGRNDPLVKFEWQEATLRAVCAINQCGEQGEKWGGYCESYSENGIPLVACLHDSQHKYPDFAPKLTVRFFKQHQRVSAE